MVRGGEEGTLTPRLERICEFTGMYLFQPIPRAKPGDAHESADRRKMGFGNEIVLQYYDWQGIAEIIILGLRSQRLLVQIQSGILLKPGIEEITKTHPFISFAGQ